MKRAYSQTQRPAANAPTPRALV